MNKCFKKIVLTVSVVILAFLCAVSANAQEHVHDYRTVITKLATCTEEGLEVVRCECGYEKSATVVPARGHNSTTIKDNRCTFCEAYFVEAGKTIEVKFDEPKYIAVAWSSTENVKVEDYFSIPLVSHHAVVKGVRAGTATLYAYRGGDIVLTAKVIIECKNHSFTNYVSDNNAGCKDGTQTAVCDYCDETNTIVDEGSAVHSYVYTSDNNATCETNGTKTGICTKCGLSQKIEEEGTSLSHAIIIDASVSATCTETGLTQGEHCSRCDYKIAQEEVPFLGHAIIIDAAVSATCTETGLTQGEHCSRCAYKVTQKKTPALGHTESFTEYVEATCTETGLSVGKKCKVCGEIIIPQQIIPAKGHSYTSWIITSEATCEANGKQIKLCSCGLFEEEIITAKGHSDTDNNNRCDSCAVSLKEETEEPVEKDNVFSFFKSFLNNLLDFFRKLFGIK